MKVLNFGSCNIDYVYQMEHFIRPGETAPCTALSAGCGGKGLNQSIALAKAGTEVYHAGLYGAEGKFLLDKMQEAGVDTSLMRLGEGANGHAIIQVERSGQNCIILYGGSNRMITREYVDEVFSNFEKDDIILLQNEINELPYIIDKAYEKGMQIVLNPSPYDSLLDECDLSKVTIFLINEVEGKMIAGTDVPEEILDCMMSKYPSAKVVLTLGSDGVIYKDADKMVKQGIFKVKAVDTTAAGDTFTGYFIAGMLKGTPIEERLRLCAKASAITVSRPGAADSIPTMEETVSADI